MKKSILLLVGASCVLQTAGANAQEIVVCDTYSRFFHKDENRQIVVATTEDEDFSRVRDVVYRLWNLPKNDDGRGETATVAVTRVISESRVSFSDKFSDLPELAPRSVLEIATEPFGDGNEYHGRYKGHLLGNTSGLGNDGFYRAVEYRLICRLAPRALGADRTPEELAEIERCRTEGLTRPLGPIARSRDGRILKMTQEEAVSYCATRGGLPTAMQLALVFNAQGVSDIPRESFREVAPRDESTFYYNDYEGYERPRCDERYERFWSSSLHQSQDQFAFSFYGNNGRIDLNTTFSNRFAVICAGQ